MTQVGVETAAERSVSLSRSYNLKQHLRCLPGSDRALPVPLIFPELTHKDS